MERYIQTFQQCQSSVQTGYLVIKRKRNTKLWQILHISAQKGGEHKIFWCDLHAKNLWLVLGKYENNWLLVKKICKFVDSDKDSTFDRFHIKKSALLEGKFKVSVGATGCHLGLLSKLYPWWLPEIFFKIPPGREWQAFPDGTVGPWSHLALPLCGWSTLWWLMW